MGFDDCEISAQSGLGEAEFLAAAKSPDAGKERGQLCEAWYFVGMKKWIAGESAVATDCFQKSVATGKKNFVEYRFAQAELKSPLRSEEKPYFKPPNADAGLKALGTSAAGSNRSADKPYALAA